jgi:hypothetical protein
MNEVSAIFAELMRRKVLRVLWIYIVAYVVSIATIGGVLQLMELTFPLRYIWVIVAGLALLPIVAVVSWRFNIVPPQLVRDPADTAPRNPALRWANMRHDVKDAGFLFLGWRSEELSGTEKRFFQPVGIGRENGNDIELNDARVSRYHAVIWAESGIWRVRDLDSANGTFIDAVRVSGTAVLRLRHGSAAADLRAPVPPERPFHQCLRDPIAGHRCWLTEASAYNRPGFTPC